MRPGSALHHDVEFAIKRGHLDLRVVYPSDRDEQRLRAMSERTGVGGFVCKSSDPEQLLRRNVAELDTEGR